MRYLIVCLDTNPAHTKFNVFDGKGANVGQLTIETADLPNFLRAWNGRIEWRGVMPESLTTID